MAVQAGPGHNGYGLGHLRPAEPCGDEAAEQGCDQWLVVDEEEKLSPLQQEPEMPDRAECGQQLSVEGGVPGAHPRQLLGVERQWRPAATPASWGPP